MRYKGEWLSHPTIRALAFRQEVAGHSTKHSFLCAMTSATSEHHLPNLPAWYRLLPKPPTEHNPALRRTSSLSQHHLFRDRPQGHASSGDDGLRRNTVHVPESSRSTNTTQVYIGEPVRPANGGSGSASPSARGRSLDMTETQSRNMNPKENLCLCPASPKIPRPRNCEAKSHSRSIREC